MNLLSKTDSKKSIIRHFHQNVLGKYPSPQELEAAHKGKLGHWLEINLGGKIDADGNADLNGYECKVDSAKVSWGDWGAPYRIFCDRSYKFFNSKYSYHNMWLLVEALGVERSHKDKGKYYSMSGDHIPTFINDSTYIGLKMIESDKDISIIYNYSSDKRENKFLKVPDELKKDGLLIYKWFGTDKSFNQYRDIVEKNKLPIEVKFSGANASVSLEERIRRKFGIYGTVVGMKNENGFFGLKFLKTINFDDWINFFKQKNVIYDTGLTTRNKRPYNQWRSSAAFMRNLDEEIYIP